MPCSTTRLRGRSRKARASSIQNSLYILGYARFVALVYRVAGHSYLALCVVQSLAGAIVPVAIYYLARATFGRAVAVVTAVLTAVSFPLVFAAAAIGHQAIDVAITVVIVGALAAAVLRPFETWWQWAGIGALFGAAIAIRETNAGFFAFAIGWLWDAIPRRANRMKPMAAAIWLTAGMLLVLTPMLARMVSLPEARLGLRVHFDHIVAGDFDADPIRVGIAKPLTDPESAWQQLRDDPELRAAHAGTCRQTLLRGPVLRAAVRRVRSAPAQEGIGLPVGICWHTCTCSS